MRVRQQRLQMLLVATLAFGPPGVAWCQTLSIITTLAGSRYIPPTSGIAALSAPVGIVSAVTQDSQGLTYFSDITTDRVYRIDSQGALSAFAGSGTQGYAGDGGPAASAALFNPRSLAFDGAGNLYIADDGNNRIRRVNPAGTISTFAGNGTKGYTGDGGPAIGASFGDLARIAFDNAGNLYISDPDNHRIRRVTKDGTIDTFAGNGRNASTGDGGPALQAALQSPAGMAFDSAGNLYVADTAANRVRRIAANGTISTLAGTGVGSEGGDGSAAAQARLNGPSGVAVDAGGAVYIADQSGSRIRRVDPVTGLISTVAGTAQVGMAGDGGPAAGASLYAPLDLYIAPVAPVGPFGFPPQAVWIADSSNFRVRRLANGTLATIAGNGNFAYTGDGGTATAATMPSPDGVVVDAAGNVDICDNFANRLRTVNSYGIINTTAGTSTAGFAGDGASATAAMLVDCNGVAADAAGNLYIADTHNRRIRKVSPSGTIGTVAGNGVDGFAGDGGQAVGAALSNPQGVAVDSQGNLYIADTGNNRIRRVNTSGVISTVAGNGAAGYTGDGGAAVDAELSGPARIALDAAGTVYFTDNGNNVVRQFAAGGAIRTVAGNGKYGFAGDGGMATQAMLANPIGLAIDSSGFILIADADNRRIRRVDASGTITTIAGNGSAALAGDGRSPLATGFGSPADVATDAQGNIYIADQADGRVRRIQPAPSSLVLSETGLAFTSAVDAASVGSKSLRILNGGAGTIGWSAAASVLSGAADWLGISPAQGTSTTAGAGVPVTIAVNPAGLAPGNYYGKIQISAPGVVNSPRFVTVVLKVLSASQAGGPAVSPAGFLFTAAAGASNPPAQTMTISELHGSSLSFTSSVSYNGAGQWLSASPAAGNIAAGKPAAIVLQPDTSGLAPGVYNASVNLSYAGGTLESIPVTLTVYAASVRSVGVSGVSAKAVSCVPTALVPVFTGLSQGFSLPAGWPTPIEVSVVDNCGQPFTTGTVTATFSNGDPPLALSNLQDGTWSGTWSPRTAASVTVTVKAAGASISGSAQAAGQLSPNAEPPIVNTGGILSAASFAAGAPTTPGEIVSIFGSSLAGGTAVAETFPLPTQLAGSQVILGGVAMPLLYAGPGQINALVPYSLPVNTTQQLIVQSGVTLSVPEPNAVAAGAPGVFTVNDSGTGAAIVAAVNPDGSEYLVSAAQPAHPGSAIVIYCTGLGGVQTAIHSGEAAPITPLATVTDPVTVTIGGVVAPVSFAGLVPTLSGLYQVNATIPAGLAGDNVPLVLTTAGVAGATVTLAVQ